MQHILLWCKTKCNHQSIFSLDKHNEFPIIFMKISPTLWRLDSDLTYTDLTLHCTYTEFSSTASDLGWNKWDSVLWSLQMGVDSIQRTACLSRFPALLSPDGNFSTATFLKVSWHFQCWPVAKNSRAVKMRKGKCTEIIQNFHKVCVTSGNGAIFARISTDKTEWTELFKFPTDSLSLILFLYSFPFSLLLSAKWCFI